MNGTLINNVGRSTFKRLVLEGRNAEAGEFLLRIQNECKSDEQIRALEREYTAKKIQCPRCLKDTKKETIASFGICRECKEVEDDS